MLSREELVRRAERLAPVLRSRAAAAEEARCCPAETIDDFVRDGLLRICQPARYGGSELGWDVLCEVSQALARGCGAQAWVQNIFSDHCQKVATFPIQAQDDIWGADPDARISADLARIPSATVARSRAACGIRGGTALPAAWTTPAGCCAAAGIMTMTGAANATSPRPEVRSDGDR